MSGSKETLRVPFVDFPNEYLRLESELTAALDQFFRRGVYILGENVAAFEREFSAWCGTKFGIGVGSGTDALHLALRALGIGTGDEVITVPNTAAATALAVSAAGATPVFVDVDAATLTMNPAQFAAAIGPRTRAVIPVHLYGQSADMDPILKAARAHGIAVVEDACQAHGAQYGPHKCGALGDLGCFSFYPTKNLGACGDAGMVVTNREDLAEKVRLLRNMGQTDRYHHRIQGYNSRLDELQAVILRTKFTHLDAWNAQRRSLAHLYTRLLRNKQVQPPVEASYGRPVYHLYVIRSSERDRLQRFLAERGVQTLIHYPVPLHLQEAYRTQAPPAGAFPVAEQAAAEILSLPLHPGLSEESVEYVCAVVAEFAHS